MALREINLNAPHQNAFSNSSDSPGVTTLVLDPAADTFERRMRQYERDRKRMDNALAQQEPIVPFKKARLNPRVAERMERLDTRGQDLGGSDNDSVDGASGAVEVAFQSTSPNAPRQWASKGQQRNNFLRRIHSDGPIERSPPPADDDDPDVIIPRKTAFTGDSPHSCDDWTAAAADVPLPTIEQESPTRRRGSPRFESLRRRASARQSSLDNILESESERLERERFAASTESSRAKRQSLRQEEIDHLRREGITTKERIALENSMPLRADDSKPSLVAAKSAKTNASSRPDTLRSRPGHKRQGSRDLLRQLARASTTPSPSRRYDGKLIRRSSSQRRSPITSRNASKEANVVETDHRLLTPPDDEVCQGQTSEPKTPVVTGAWINTPAPERKHGPKNEPLEGAKEDKGFHHEDGKPKSALDSVLRESNATDGFGDSTIASLKGILVSDDTADIPLDDETIDLINQVNIRVGQGEDARQEEKALVQRMGGLLRNARVGVRDASKGLKRVEKQVEEAKGKLLTTGGRCEQCGCPRHISLKSILSGAMASFMENFYTWTGRGMQLTWLGLISVLLLSWYMTEVTLCEYYCHPIYARYMDGYGVDINAPRMPYVATTILVQRPFGWLIRPFWRGSWNFWRGVTLYCLKGVGLLDESAGIDSNFGYDGFGGTATDWYWRDDYL